MEYLQKAMHLSRSNNALQAITPYYEALYYQRYNKALAKSMYLRTDSLLSRYKTQKAYAFRFWTWHAYSKLIDKEDNDQSRMNIIINKALPLAQQSGDSGLVGICYGSMAIIFVNNARLEEAEEYYKKAINYLRKSPYKAFLVTMYSRAANAYMIYDSKLIEDKIQMEILRKRLPLIRALLDSARSLLGGAIHSPSAIEYFRFKGKYFRINKQYDEAHKSLDSGMAIARAFNQLYEIEALSIYRYHIYSAQGQYKKAKTLLLHIIDHPVIAYKGNKLGYYYELALTFARLGDYKNAYEWSDKTLQMRDSVYFSHERSAIDEMELKYQTVEKERMITKLQLDKAQATLKSRTAYLYSVLLALSCFVLLVIVIAILQLYLKNKKRSKQRLKKVQQEQELKLTQALLQGEEQERQRLAQELHDGLGSMLAGVKINLSDIVSSEGNRYNQGLRNVMQQLDNSTSELRRIAHNMMPTMLLRYGLEVSLRDLCALLIPKTISIDLQCLNISKTIPINIQLVIYRIVQELLSNAVKHSDARNIMVQCSQDKDIFLITIEDDGRGFVVDEIASNHGIGIHNVKRRVAYLNGTIEFLKRDQQSGVIINIELHLQPQSANTSLLYNE
ncbi:sensor histidine kinase [Taibaiella helva]|uniref:sensor histidine kinase n=1 Tax=Taibaiella helva TaxID=2301235 RepID=UPI0018E59683|nr:sensor histidine kinase [Taibaiella helva]